MVKIKPAVEVAFFNPVPMTSVYTKRYCRSIELKITATIAAQSDIKEMICVFT